MVAAFGTKRPELPWKQCGCCWGISGSDFWNWKGRKLTQNGSGTIDAINFNISNSQQRLEMTLG
jgi:hypothetical protein